MDYELDYDYITECIENAGLTMMTSECHGNACGVLCSQIAMNSNDWFDSLVSGSDISVDHVELLADLLRHLYEITEQFLNNIDFEFELFLPDDEVVIRERLDALGEWCSGFLLGLSVGGISDVSSLPDEIANFLKDCLEIARVGNSELNNSEDDETSYTELVEYVRMGVMTMFEEIYQLKNAERDADKPTSH
ncbi:hypothetical protein MNBD_GAMMA22-356 [hydrothermal vent metagenome]|uniref:YecA family protein n=1 Tax=hydrothermal vent metagenome TaxID=652676 RepID=A0A3B1AV29_9ZZZZ